MMEHDNMRRAHSAQHSPSPIRPSHGRRRPAFLLALCLISTTALAANQGHGGGAAPAGDSAAKVAVCQACHGADGATPLQPDYPKLAGQHQDYLARALHAYKSGMRSNPIMSGQAAALTDQDIKFLAEYYANLPAAVYTLNGRR